VDKLEVRFTEMVVSYCMINILHANLTYWFVLVVNTDVSMVAQAIAKRCVCCNAAEAFDKFM